MWFYPLKNALDKEIQPFTTTREKISLHLEFYYNKKRREIVETSMSWAESDTGRLFAAISEEGESACLCLWFRRWSVS